MIYMDEDTLLDKEIMLVQTAPIPLRALLLEALKQHEASWLQHPTHLLDALAWRPYMIKGIAGIHDIEALNRELLEERLASPRDRLDRIRHIIKPQELAISASQRVDSNNSTQIFSGPRSKNRHRTRPYLQNPGCPPGFQAELGNTFAEFLWECRFANATVKKRGGTLLQSALPISNFAKIVRASDGPPNPIIG
jgi:hypothetical protein